MLLACAIVGHAALASGAQLSRQIRIGPAPDVSGATPIGAVAASTRLHLTIALRPRDPAALAAFARAVSTPGSSSYRAYLTPAQFGRRFGATMPQVEAVSSSMRAHGLVVGRVGANQLSIPLSGTAAQVQRAFSLTFKAMALGNGKRAVAASAAPALDRQIAGYVQAVIGLSSVSAPKPLLVRPSLLRPAARGRLVARSSPRVATGGPQACAAASSAASSQHAYAADQIAAAYRFSGLYGAGAQGQGVTVAVYELESSDPNDIAAYQACYGTHAPISYVQVDGGSGGGAGSGEAALDIEQTIGLAPKANILVYQGPNSGSNQNGPGSGPYDTLSAIVTEDRAKVVSMSWGQCEQLVGSGDAQSEGTLFEEAAAQGQSVAAVAGDQGSEDCNNANGVPAAQLAVDDPGSQPFVTSVGGTTLSSLGPPPSETVWNNAGNATGLLPAQGVQGGAGGGGLSQFWSMPGYQSGAAGSLHVIGASSSGSSCGSGNCRQVPDVAANADPGTGYIIYWNGSGSDPTSPSGWQSVGGTSASAPLWAALLADVDSSAACHGSPIGFANPALYRAAGDAYGNYFNDITSGNNDFTGTNSGLYPAGPAYDMASGLGTPNAGALGPAMCGDTLRVNNPGPQASAVGQQVRLQITTIPGGTKLSYSAGQLPPGLSISNSTGLITGKPKRAGTWTVTVAALAQSLALRAASFTWTIREAPVVSQASLSGVSSGRMRLGVTIAAGTGARELKSASVGLPRGLSFGSLRRGVTVTTPTGRRLAFRSRLAGGRLQITLAKPAQTVRITVSAPAIRVTQALAGNVRRHRAGTLTVTVRATDAAHQATTTSAPIQASS